MRALAASGVALATLLQFGSAQAWCRTTTSTAMPMSPTDCITEGEPLFWPRRCQTFSLDSSAGGGLTLAQFRTAVTASFDTWNAVTCSGHPIFDVSEGGLVTCDHAEYSSTGGNSNAVAFADDFRARMYPDDAIAITIVWHDTRNGRIYDADILVNQALGPFVDCPDAGCPAATTRFDIRNVITHEAGHFLGLSHSADDEATMFYRADPGETNKRSLGADDVAGICAVYGDASVPAECDPTPNHGFDADCTGEETPTAAEDDGCGCAIQAPARTPGMLGIGLAALIVSRLRRRRPSP